MKTVTFCILSGFIFWAASAQGDMQQIKNYKETYPDAKPKCINCHIDEHPKKADGQHDANDYGKAAVKAAKAAGLDKPTADTYKTLGPHS
jgi:hypothetical protein